MKKTISLLLCFCMILGILASCGENNEQVVSNSDNSQVSKEDVSSLDTSSEEEIPSLDEGLELKVPLLEQELKNKKRVRILPLGDSFTVIGPAAYRFYLYEMLYQNGNFFQYVGSRSTSDTRLSKYYTRFQGTGGHKSSDGLKVYNETIAGKIKYDVMVLFYGINDVHSESQLPQFRTDYSALLDAISADNPQASVFAVGAPKVYTADATKQIVEEYKKKGMDITYVNVFQQDDVKFSNQEDYITVTTERTHLNDSGNLKFATAVFNAIKDRITELNKETVEKANNLPQAVNKVTLSHREINIKIGESKQVTYQIEPASADTQSVVWHTSNDKIAVVDEYGIITAKGEGETNVTAISLDGKAYNVCKVKVSAENFSYPAVNSEVVFEDNFNDNSKWESSAQKYITVPNTQNISFDYETTGAKISTEKSYEIPENFTLTFEYSAGLGSVTDEKMYNSVIVGDYKISILKGTSEFVLYQNNKEIARYNCGTRVFKNDSFVLSVVDSKAYFLRNNELLITADVTPNKTTGKITVERQNTSCVSAFDNIKITK